MKNESRAVPTSNANGIRLPLQVRYYRFTPADPGSGTRELVPSALIGHGRTILLPPGFTFPRGFVVSRPVEGGRCLVTPSNLGAPTVFRGILAPANFIAPPPDSSAHPVSTAPPASSAHPVSTAPPASPAPIFSTARLALAAPPVSSAHLAPPVSTPQLAPPVSTTHRALAAPPVSATHPDPPVSTRHLALATPPVSTPHLALATPPVSTPHLALVTPPVSTTHPDPPVSTTHPAPPVSTPYLALAAPPVSTAHPLPAAPPTTPARLPSIYNNTATQSKKECRKVKWVRIQPDTARNSFIPAPRHGHRAIAYKHLMIVFGGGNEGIFGEVNVYDTLSNEWSQPHVKGIIPRGRAAYGAVIDGHRIIIFGGMQEDLMCTDELYELNVIRWEWTLLNPSARTPEEQPCGRLGHSFTLVKDKVFMFGGLGGPLSYDGVNQPNPTYMKDLHVLCSRQNMQHGVWEIPVVQGTPPCPRESHTAVYFKDAWYNKLIIYGGMFGNRLGDLHTLDLDSMTWTQLKCDGRTHFPSPRSLHSASVIGDRMYVFGGWVNCRESIDAYKTISTCNMWQCDNLTACLNMKTMTWEKMVLETASLEEDVLPECRAGHSAVVINNKIYIWSGRDGFRKMYCPEQGRDVQVCFDDLWKLDVQKPGTGNKVKLLRPEGNMLSVCWDPVPGADGYILQIASYGDILINTTSFCFPGF